ncbi:hypothetical protein BD414DRAFT_509384 [Trametes punicea]|nr:hypothetical protein BD414DRAFT_509384 [Trametes punicea]
MVAPMFILTRSFAICAMFLGAFPLTYAVPIPTAVSTSVLEPRYCRLVGCLYALPEGTTSDEDSSNSSDPSPTSSLDASSSALQVIDLLISALQAAASTLNDQASSAPLASSTDDAIDTAIPAIIDSPLPTEADPLSAVIGAVVDAAPLEDAAEYDPPVNPTGSPTSVPASEAFSSDAEDGSDLPAVEVVG